jgi:hypothetical protein
MQTACQAVAKVVINRRLNTVRVLVTFDVAARKVSVLNASYVSGDICNADLDLDLRKIEVAKTLAVAAKQLRTDNICVV